MNTHSALDRYLEYLGPSLHDTEVTEIMVNKPGELYIEKHGSMVRHSMPDLNFDRLKMIADHSMRHSEQPEFSEDHPLLSATLPDGARMQGVMSPATEAGRLVLSIRKQTITKMSLDDYDENGGYDETQKSIITPQPTSDVLRTLYRKEKYHQFVKKALAHNLNILISGGTSSGKTRYLSACLGDIPHDERIITIEDNPELKDLIQQNHVPLLYARGGHHQGKHTPQDLVETSLRLRPDRIIMGELRGAEAFSFLHAINTGHPGSLATIHANSPQLALRRLSMMIMQAGTGMKYEDIVEYVRGTIDVIIHVARLGQRRWGAREIYYAGAYDD